MNARSFQKLSYCTLICMAGCVSSQPVANHQPDAAPPVNTSIVPEKDPPTDFNTIPSSKNEWNQQRIANLKAQLEAYVESYGQTNSDGAFSGYIMIAHDDDVIYGHGFGTALENNSAPPNEHTSFRIASVTKQFTAFAILRYVDRGELQLGAKVSDYLKNFSGPAKDVTLHQLLTHTSGVPNPPFEWFMENRAKTVSTADLLASFSQSELMFSPGTKFGYSNANYNLLAAILESVSGLPYADIVKTEILEPADLQETQVGELPRRTMWADGFTLNNDGKLELAPEISGSHNLGAGEIRSTASDLLKWSLFLQNKKNLSSKMYEKLFTPQLENYAYGWAIEDDRGHRVHHHNGGIEGFSNSYVWYPEDKLTILVWTNRDHFPNHEVVEAAKTLALGFELEPRKQINVVQLSENQLKHHAGVYKLDPESAAQMTEMGMPKEALEEIMTVTISSKDGQLLFKPAGQGTVVLTATSTDDFYFEPASVVAQFGKNRDGKRTLLVTQGAIKMEYTEQKNQQ